LQSFGSHYRFHRLEGTDQEKMLIEDIISQIESETPFSAMGYFNIELSTMTSIISTVLTYIIILVQFNPSFTDANKLKPQNSTL
jgi:hypothetical protein